MFSTRSARTSLRLLAGVVLIAIRGTCAFCQPQIQIPQTPGQVAPTPGAVPQAGAVGTLPEPSLELDDITGTSAVKTIHVIDWRFATVTSGTTTRPGAPSLTDLVIVKPIDASTPVLFRRCLEAKLIPSGRVWMLLGDDALFELAMENIRVTSVGRPPSDQTLAASNERVRLTADRYTISVRAGPGSFPTSWDQTLNR